MLHSNVMRLFPFGLVLLSACGIGDHPTIPPCTGNPVVGRWQVAHADALYIDESCSGRMLDCNYRFDFTPSGTDSQTLNITNSTGAAGCLAVGTHACTVVLTEPQLSVDCGTSTYVFTRY